MRTQSRDTHPEAERVLIGLIRAASSQKRFRLVQSLTRSSIWASVHHWQGKYPVASEREAAVLYVSSAHGVRLAACVKTALQHREEWQIQPIDLLAAIQPALQIFDRLGIFAYLGGSLASSVHGMQQLAQDIDLVIDLPNTVSPELLPLLQEYYILDLPNATEVLQQRCSFSCLHQDTLQKIDLIIPHAGAFDEVMHQQLVPHVLDERYPPVRIASAPEMILWKLRRYHRYGLASQNGMQDDATWNDVLGMLKVQGMEVDRTLLDHWVKAFGLEDVFTQALTDAGHLPDPSERQTQDMAVVQ
jgi:hypothetical protein